MPQIPKDFILGVADSDLQVIGEKFTRDEEGSEPTMWSEFCGGGKCFQSRDPDMGVDRFHRFQEDIALMKEMGVKHYRTSVSLSRTLHANGTPNEKAFAWYKNYFQALQRAGIKIYLTLYHWELPNYLSQEGGWTNKKTIDYFLKHTALVAERLGEYVEEYFVLNEPWCSAFLGHFTGLQAPGEKNLSQALLATHNLLLAQGAAVRFLHTLTPRPKISTVTMVEPAYPASDSEEDILAAQYADEYQNWWFLDPLYFGTYPELLKDHYGSAMPAISSADMKEIQVGNLLHDLGLNCYGGKWVKWKEEAPFKFDWAYKEGSERNDVGWVFFAPPMYPEGLHDILTQTYLRYKDAGIKNLFVTETGFAERTDWDGKTNILDDSRRIRFLEEQLRQTLKAVEEGIPVKGFFVWTLLDNFEWQEGYRGEACFGLVHVDRETLQRVWKKSGKWYQQVLKGAR